MLSRLFFFVVAMPLFIFSSVCNGSDTLLPGQSLFSNQTLVSKGGKFELGFFSPGNSSNYYIGIWYKNIPVQTVVWVLNRDEPILYSSYNDSGLQLQLQLFSNSSVYINHILLDWLPYSWRGLNSSEAVLLDTGNFVLRDSAGFILWQSFDYPTDTWLPGMNLSKYDPGGSRVSWMDPNDPAGGIYSLEQDRRELFVEMSQLVCFGPSNCRVHDKVMWRSGPLQGGMYAYFSGYSSFDISFNFTYFPISADGYDDDYIVYNVYNESVLSRIVIDYLGRLMHYGWSEARQAWIVLSCNAADPICRPNTICNVNSSPACRCLEGFVPRVQQDWNVSDFTLGCEIMRTLECGGKSETNFIYVATARLPANPQSQRVPNDVCNFECSGNCSCTAYHYASDNGSCLLFMGDLSSLEKPSNNSVAMDLYLKTESSHHTSARGGKVLVVALTVPIAAALFISCFCFCYMWPKLKNKESGVTRQNLLQLDLSSNENRDVEEKNSRHEFPIFSFSSIVASTNNFSLANKLGEGGFGPVYKGEVLNGQFVAVKRLSRSSGQGVDEFKNETELVAQLQHRNLVGILGCCTENDEMILVYEYMSNKSLDCFLFDQTKKELLDWTRRVHIISGIAQGLLYLHHDSRLRIVHRDLKASNILLDAEMNPKISDFGMARIFGGNEMQANTKRIVGTYGYMSPEYAMEGRFSVKSDVFAFGVLMLEIITGKKNTGLLKYAWDLWKHDSAHQLIDPTLEMSDSSSSVLALRYIQIILLCVEENPTDRPLISEVVGMLDNEKGAIASPKNPAFTLGKSMAKATPTKHKVEIWSVNDLTLSNVEAR